MPVSSQTTSFDNIPAPMASTSSVDSKSSESVIVLPPRDRFLANLINLCDIVKDLISLTSNNDLPTLLIPTFIDGYKTVLQGIEKDSKSVDNKDDKELLSRYETAMLSKNKMIDVFIEKSARLWDDIKERKVDVLSGAIIAMFPKIPPDYISFVKNMMTCRVSEATAENVNTLREHVWRTAIANIKISISHIHVTRSPRRDDSGKTRYTQEYFPQLSVRELTEKWHPTLDKC